MHVCVFIYKYTHYPHINKNIFWMRLIAWQHCLYTFWKDSYAPYWWHDFYLKTQFKHGGVLVLFHIVRKNSISDICIDVCDKELLFVSCPLDLCLISLHFWTLVLLPLSWSAVYRPAEGVWPIMHLCDRTRHVLWSGEVWMLSITVCVCRGWLGGSRCTDHFC